MRPKLRTAAWTAGALLYGVAAGLFLVFRTLFTDGPGDPLHPEYLLAHGLTLLGYAVPAWFLAWRVRTRPGWWSIWLGAPGLAFVLAYDDSGLAVRLLTATAMLLGLALGEWAGAWTRLPRTQE